MPRPSSIADTIEAKLSSVRTMSALSFATSVPVIPIATPRSDRLRAGASFNRRDRVRPRGIHHPRQAEEREVRLERVFPERRDLARELPDREAEDAQGPRRHLLIPEQVLFAVVLGQRLSHAFDNVICACSENPFRGPLHKQVGARDLEAASPTSFGAGEGRSPNPLRQSRAQGAPTLSRPGGG